MHKGIRNSGCRFILIWTLSLCCSLALSAQGQDAKIRLRDHWALQSSCNIRSTGAQISLPGFSITGWHQTTVPSTVLAALVADHTYPDPFFAENLWSIPGASKSAEGNFTLQPMPEDSPFRCSWWFRTEFHTPNAYAGHFISLHLDGVDQRANVWLNGKRIASTTDVDGAFRIYEFAVTALVKRNATNALAIETFAQTPQDLGINWIDWNPTPPDKNMGLRRDVYLESNGPVSIRNPFVITHFPSASLDDAELTVEVELRNQGRKPATGKLDGEIDGLKFEQNVSLAAQESRTMRLGASQFPQLHMGRPKLWWPAQMGEPSLHDLQLQFVVKGVISDEQNVRFGIREITSSIDANGHRLFRVNGKPVMIRGAGWAPDMLLRQFAERLQTEFQYIRDLNLNTIRLEGKMESDEFYDLADQQGVLVLPGWACCDRWQDGDKWTEYDREIATESLRSQIKVLRRHPSVLAWLNGSDAGPPPDVEQTYLAVLKQLDWPNPILFSASERPSQITGPTGVKMTGPYDYVPPDFWLSDDGRSGGATGFNTETSPGPSIPIEDSLAKMFPADHLKPGDPLWLSHTALGKYSKLDHFDETMREVYGPPQDLADYERKAQAMSYDSERAMFEAYSRNKYASTTGIIQWMLNNAWPSLFWHLYDYYLQPAGAYFGAKKALEPIHVQYSYDDGSVVVVNSTYQAARALRLSATVYDSNLHTEFSRQTLVDVEPDSVARVMTIPAEASGSASPLHYANLVLSDSAGSPLSRNFYWTSSRRNIFNWHKASYRFTPVESYEDLTALLGLRNVDLRAIFDAKSRMQPGTFAFLIENPATELAFQIRLAVRPKAVDSGLVPVIWSDNYFELLPGESREVTARLLTTGSADQDLQLLVNGWNINRLELKLPASKWAYSSGVGINPR